MKKRLAIFDIDGTIFRKNLHFELIDNLVYQGVFGKDIRKELIKFYRSWLENEGTYECYRDELIKLYNQNIINCEQTRIKKVAKSVAKFNAKRIYIFAKNKIEELRKKYVMLMISGSPIEIVEEYAKILQFDDFFGTVYGIDGNNKYTGEEIFTPVKNKGLVVKQYIAENGLSLKNSFGIGDTESDANFLKLVDEPIAFNPNLNLKKIAEKNKWKIVVEKKDVVYNIN